MNFHNLQCIIEVWKCGSINKAAQNLFTSQSNLSHSLRTLESELGFSIFTRSSKGIEPTQEGTLFIQSAQTILTEYNKIKQIPTQMHHCDNLSISCTYSSLFMRTFIQFLNDHPANGYRDTFKETGLIQTMQDVIEQRYRMSIFYCFESRKEYHAQNAARYHLELVPLRQHLPLEVIVSTSIPLAQHESVSYHELGKYNFVTYENFNPADWLDILGLKKEEKVTYIFDRGGLLDTIRTGKYITTVIKNSIEIRPESGVKALPLTDFDQSLGIYLLKSNTYQMSPREKQFIRFMKNCLKSTLKSD